MIALGFVNARNPSGPAGMDSTVSARNCPIISTHKIARGRWPWSHQTVNPGSAKIRGQQTHEARKAERAYVENTKVVNRNHSTFDLFRDLDSISLVRSKDTSPKAVFRSVGEFDGLLHGFVSLDHCDGSEHYHKGTSAPATSCVGQ